MFPPVQLASFAILLVAIANRTQHIFYVRNFTYIIHFIFLWKEHYFTDSATLPSAHQYTFSHTHTRKPLGGFSQQPVSFSTALHVCTHKCWCIHHFNAHLLSDILHSRQPSAIMSCPSLDIWILVPGL